MQLDLSASRVFHRAQITAACLCSSLLARARAHARDPSAIERTCSTRVRSLLSLYSMGDKVRYPALRPRHTRRARPVDCALSSARDGRAPRLVNGLRERLLLARAGHGANAELAGLTLTFDRQRSSTLASRRPASTRRCGRRRMPVRKNTAVAHADPSGLQPALDVRYLRRWPRLPSSPGAAIAARIACLSYMRPVAREARG